MLCIIKNNQQVRESWKNKCNCIHWKQCPFSFPLQCIKTQGNQEYIWKISSPCLSYFSVSSSSKSLSIRLILETLGSQGLVFDREICWGEEKLSCSLEILSWVRVSVRIMIWVWNEVGKKKKTGYRTKMPMWISRISLSRENIGNVYGVFCLFVGFFWCWFFLCVFPIHNKYHSHHGRDVKWMTGRRWKGKNKGRLGVSVN